MNRPLEGIRVLDCGIYHAGPGGLAILGDLGAEVIKVEEPGTGDPIRMVTRIGRIPLEIPGGRSIFCEGANRNKKSVAVNLKTRKGQEIVHRLVTHSDVFMTNMRQEAVEAMNIAYPVLREINPRLIYASVSAFGPKGPDRDRGGFDYQGQARSGLMYSMGEVDTPPMVCQFGIIDQATAIMVSHHIITALFMRERTGIGQEVHVSILGSATFLLYFNILIAYMAGFEVPRHRRSTEHAMRNYYQCGDGRWLMMTLTPPDRHWGPLCQALGHPELENDPRFDTDDKRLENAEPLVNIFDRIFATRPRDEWLKTFAKYDLFCCGVNSVTELANDPQVTENDYLVDFEHPTLGKVKIPGYPVHFSETFAKTTRAAPELGEHTEEVLIELGGYTREELTVFRDEGVL
jgi:crotonobetainyl-CoA:carnitine CoA-transferase CaiB-like acyl-CoA transferase